MNNSLFVNKFFWGIHLKKFINIVSLMSGFLFFSCSSHVEQVQPAWYANSSPDAAIIFGYGFDKSSRENAIKKAYGDISQQISVQVAAEQRSVKKVSSDNFSSSFISHTKIDSAHKLTGARVVNESQINGYGYYVQVRLDLRSTAQQITEKLLKNTAIELSLNDCVQFTGMEVLRNSPLLSGIANNFNQSSTEKCLRLNSSLQRLDTGWILHIGAASQIITINDLSNLLAWPNTNTSQFSLVALENNEPINRVYSGREFTLQLLSTSEEGYYYLFNIYSDGRLNLLAEHESLKVNQHFPADGQVLVAVPIVKGETDRDSYIAIHTSERIDTTQFLKVHTEVIREKAFNLPHLIQLMNTKEIINISRVYLEIMP